MMHSPGDFTAHVLDLLKNSGPSGPTGPTMAKPLISNDKVGTSRRNDVGPVENEWSHQARASGPGKRRENQSLKGTGTTGTSGTSLFAGGEDQCEQGGSPPKWHAILADLERQSCPDWLSPDRWNEMLSDAENFLSRWGAAAHSLGWTALDLFGVHPLAPASRFDVMGLLLVTQGGTVVVLTADAATLRRTTGATLSYQRPTQVGAVLISKVRP